MECNLNQLFYKFTHKSWCYIEYFNPLGNAFCNFYIEVVKLKKNINKLMTFGSKMILRSD